MGGMRHGWLALAVGMALGAPAATLDYASHLGGSDVEYAGGIAVGPAGNVIVAGETGSSGFPSTMEPWSGDRDLFLAKFGTTGSNLIYSTLYGGSGFEGLGGMAFAPNAKIYVAGSVAGAGGYDILVVCFSNSGHVCYNTTVSGPEEDIARHIAVDPDGYAYIVGETGGGLPVTGVAAYGQTYGGGNYDGYLLRLDPTGGVNLCAYLGTTNNDAGYAVALDASTNVYVALNVGYASRESAYLVKLTSRGSNQQFMAPLYRIYTSNDFARGRALAVDGRTNCYVAGETYTTNFPIAGPAIQPKPGTGSDGFLAIVDGASAGGTVTYSSYFGGAEDQAATSIVLDGQTNIVVAGENYFFSPFSDIFVARLNSAGSTLLNTVTISEPDHQFSPCIALDLSSNVWILAETMDDILPTTNAYDRTFAGGFRDAILMQLNWNRGATVTVSSVAATEGTGGTSNFTFKVTMAPTFGAGLAYNYAASNQSAVAGSDFSENRGTNLVFTPGIATQAVTVLVTGDASDESNETFTVNLLQVRNATVAAAQGVGAINDDDPAPSASIADVTVTERDLTQNTNANFVVSLSAASGLIVTMNCATANGTAVAPGDYTNRPSTKLSFNPGESARTVTVVVVGDVMDEDNETFVVNVSGPGNATLADAQGQGTITDNDPAPSFTIGNASTNELDAGQTDSAVVRAALSPPSGKTVTVQWGTVNGTATAGADYASGNGTLTFTAGQTNQAITRPVYGDDLDEFNETFQVTLRTPTNAALLDGTGVVTIVDNDSPPHFILPDSSTNELDAGASNNMAFTVQLSAPSGKPVSVNWGTSNGSAWAGTDYAAGAGLLSLTPGQTNGTVTRPVLGDNLDEFDETFLLTFRTPTNASIADSNAQGAILDNDPPAAASFVDEWLYPLEGDTGSTTVNHRVILYEPSGKTVTVQYATFNASALAGSDYTAAGGALVFAPGQTSFPVACTVLGDTVDETNEYFTVRVTNIVNGGQDILEERVIIVDDDVDLALLNTLFAAADGTVRLSWPAFTGKTYRVQYHTNLLSGTDWAPLGDDIVAVQTNISTNYPAGTISRRFYRVIQLIP
ncbi:MAG TPA: Calx-beta domain-containing protein [Kiritimatiellia bacterium]|nr:Calx-beta domain-containing protein [Kiritimatiellia bacterium]HRZ13632.1 Calx-beta domain-containing protein [Kiritimatiellia bacterium]HSA19272.1 Calx-beta domain-containing protein [Kiritimatiellia bacterium]